MCFRSASWPTSSFASAHVAPMWSWKSKMSPQDNQCYFWWRGMFCVCVCWRVWTGGVDWELAEKCLLAHAQVCVCAHKGSNSKALVLLQSLWCHPPTFPLCFHSSVSQPRSGSLCEEMHACARFQAGGIFNSDSVVLSIFLKEISARCSILQREGGSAGSFVPCCFDRRLQCRKTFIVCGNHQNTYIYLKIPQIKKVYIKYLHSAGVH